MPIRKTPGRPRKGEPPAPSRRRVVKVPLDLDGQVVKTAQANGLSYQAAVRDALVLWLEAMENKPSQPE